MATAKISKEDIYRDARIAKLLKEKLQTVADNYGCHLRYVQQVIQITERGHVLVMAHNNHEQKWNNKYKCVQEYLNSRKTITKRHERTQRELIRAVFEEGFDVDEIVKYTGKSTQNVTVVLWG